MYHSVPEFLEAAKQDEQYAALLLQLKSAERQMDAAELTMTLSERDTVWDFFDILEDIHYRLLELAIKHADMIPPTDN